MKKISKSKIGPEMFEFEDLLPSITFVVAIAMIVISFAPVFYFSNPDFVWQFKKEIFMTCIIVAVIAIILCAAGTYVIRVFGIDDESRVYDETIQI